MNHGQITRRKKWCNNCKYGKQIETFIKNGIEYEHCKRCRSKIRKANRKRIRDSKKAAIQKTARVIVITKKFHSGAGGSYKERNKNLRRLGFGTYGEYLKSQMWKEVRERVFAAKGRSCCKCNGDATQVHHDWYGVADLNGERISNLYQICKQCHTDIEHDSKGNKITVFKVVRQKFAMFIA